MEELKFHPLAREELRDAVLYYKGIYRELGLDFQRRVEAAVKAIRGGPEQWRIREGGYRRFNLRRFPYYLPYIVEQNSVWLLAVANARRKPEYWTKRVEDI